jgi:hypothetical protein
MLRFRSIGASGSVLSRSFLNVVNDQHVDGHGLFFQSKPKPFLESVEDGGHAGIGVGGTVDIDAFEGEVILPSEAGLVDHWGVENAFFKSVHKLGDADAATEDGGYTRALWPNSAYFDRSTRPVLPHQRVGDYTSNGGIPVVQ